MSAEHDLIRELVRLLRYAYEYSPYSGLMSESWREDVADALKQAKAIPND